MIARIWDGWTSTANARAYEVLLKSEIFVGFESRNVRGFNGIELLSRSIGTEIVVILLP
jgi:hypothetical protein